MWAHESHVGQSVPWWKEKMRVVPVSQDHGRKRAHSCLLPVFIRKEVYPNWLCKWGGVSACETDAYWEGGGIKSTVNETAVIMSSRSSYLVSFLPHITAVSLMVVLDLKYDWQKGKLLWKKMGNESVHCPHFIRAQGLCGGDLAVMGRGGWCLQQRDSGTAQRRRPAVQD